MRTEKKTEIIRLVIYCVLSCLPFIAVIFLRAHYGEPFCTAEYLTDPAVTALISFAMLAPAAANILTRLITKEGFKDMKLGLNLKGSVKYYILSVAVPMIYAAAACLIVCAMFLDVNSVEQLFTDTFFSTSLPVLLITIATVPVMLLPYFGEEFGWRGYMMPKLIKLIGKPAAVIVGGIIWGLWHAPVTAQGHNFGVDYPFFPWLGILLMCVFCTAMNAFLTLITEKTNSVYPASIAHGINNSFAGTALLTVILSESAILSMSEKMAAFEPQIMISVICFIPTVITGGVSFVILCKKNNQVLRAKCED